jgi:hypothetical protein
MKIELTIKTDYMPNWGSWEGIRELIQNGRDAEVEQGAPLLVKHRPETNTLILENEGTTLSHEALLLGHTSKLDRPDLIGKFGEGLKLGILALVRKGHKIRIRSGSEVWVPSIQKSGRFNADVLVFDIQKGRKNEPRVAVEVSGVSTEEWAKLKSLFLFLPGSIKPEEQITTITVGSLLVGERFKGKIYVKGIYVSEDSKLSYGYDFREADIDRDRRMISSFELEYQTQRIWREALNQHPEMVHAFGALLNQEAADVEGVSSYNVDQIPEAARTALVSAFRTEHGEGALPVSNTTEATEIEHMGGTGVVAPRALRLVLEQELGNVSENRFRLRQEVTRKYGFDDLTHTEKSNVLHGIAYINGVEPLSWGDIEVVDFRDKSLCGMFKDDRILLAKKILVDRALTMKTQIHEVAYRVGFGGEKSHGANVERIWSGIATSMESTIERLEAPPALRRLTSGLDLGF